jgi:hypothetical protein
MVNEIQEDLWRGGLKNECWNQNNLTLAETLCCFCRGIYRPATWKTKTEDRLKNTYTDSRGVEHYYVLHSAISYKGILSPLAMLQNITSNDNYGPRMYVKGLFLPIPVYNLLPSKRYQTLEQYRGICCTNELADGDDY